MQGINPELKERYDRDGFVIMRNLISPEDVQALRAAIDEAVANCIEPIGFDSTSPETLAAVPAIYKNAAGQVARRLNRVVDRGGAFERVASGPLAQAVTQLVSPPIYLCLNRHNMVMLKAPFNHTPVHWHQDHWREGVYDIISAIVALDDFQPENGALEVVPGSHLHGDLHIANTLDRDEGLKTIAQDAVKVDLKAGDAVFFHVLLLHGSGGNSSDRTRRSLTVAYSPGDLREKSTVHEGPLRPEVREVVPAGG